MKELYDKLAPTHQFIGGGTPFTPRERVTEAINGRQKEGINERPHSGLFEQMQEMVPVLRGMKNKENEQNEEVDK